MDTTWNRDRWLLLVVAVFSSAAFGCEKKNKNAADERSPGAAAAGTAKGGEVKAEAEPDLTPTAPRTGFSVFPKDSEILISVNFSSVRKSSLWGTYKEPLSKKLHDDSDYKQFVDVCQLDLMNEVESLVVGGSVANEDRMVIVLKGLSKPEVDACAKKVKEKDASTRRSRSSRRAP
jgi:hypothetical protein